jgi:hypothetical protein
MALDIAQANLYTLSNADTSVTYTPLGFGGTAQLNYRRGEQDVVFRGADVRTLATEIGALVTVDLDFIPDLETTTFSLFIPAVNLRNGATEAAVETVGLLTAARTSFGGPALVQGQLKTYQALVLTGAAQLVDF